ncbi:MAG: pyridoxal phosphate-dependent aminotransferase [Lachnospiraceae bacterium]|nr:pyridoxal phosphate-dependent aminotransferase [Lachnospiraceae bacterium]
MFSKCITTMAGSNSIIRRLFEDGMKMARERGAENVFDFSIGNPSVPAPAKVETAIKQILQDRESVFVHGYMKNAGYDEVREKVADYMNRHFDAGMTQDNIMMIAGAAAGMNIIFHCLLDPEDEVICFAPFFSEYRNYALNYGARVTAVPPIPHFRLNVEGFKAAVTEKTKAVVINSPNNPTGVIYTEEELRAFDAALREAEAKVGHPIVVISDEPYRELAYDGARVPYLPALVHNAVICYSWSKSLSLPGERIGYIAVPSAMTEFEDFMNALNMAGRALGYVNAPSLFQLVVAECLEELCDVEAYDANRHLLYEALTANGFECVKPEGAFYLFVKSPVPDENEFVEAGRELGILMVPMGTWGAPGYVRLAYCTDPAMIRRSLPAFEKLAARYHKR